MSEYRRFLKALWKVTVPERTHSPRKPEPVALLDSARREMEEIHVRNRERAIQAITQKNNLQQIVDDLEGKIKQLSVRAQAEEIQQNWSRASQVRREQSRYEESLATTQESLRKATEVSEAVKAHIQKEQNAVREKTTELLVLQSEWRASAIKDDIERRLHAKVHCIFDAGYTLYPLKAARDVVGALLVIIVALVALVVFLVLR